jgi:hypothetical protein
MFTQLHPTNTQGIKVRDVIEEGIKREALYGMGIVGIGVAAVGFLASVLLKRK